MILLYLLLLPFALADIVYYRPHDPHRGVKIFGFVMASLCGAALFAWAGWILLRRRRRIQIMRAQVVVVVSRGAGRYGRSGISASFFVTPVLHTIWHGDGLLPAKRVNAPAEPARRTVD